VITVKIV